MSNKAWGGQDFLINTGLQFDTGHFADRTGGSQRVFEVDGSSGGMLYA